VTAAELDVDALTTEERLALLDRLWESLRRTPEQVPLSDEQRDELDRRLDDLDEDGPVGIPWHEVLRRLRGEQA
jgi:putative addiction module component (TIGR02574 family)